MTSPVPAFESSDAVRIEHAERGHPVEYLAPDSVLNSLPCQGSRHLVGLYASMPNCAAGDHILCDITTRAASIEKDPIGS